MSKKTLSNVDFSPSNRAFTGGCGKPTKERENDGRQAPPSKMGMQYARAGASPSRVRSGTTARAAGIYGHLAPYANNKPPKPVSRAPDDISPKQRPMWHKLRKLGLV